MDSGNGRVEDEGWEKAGEERWWHGSKSTTTRKSATHECLDFFLHFLILLCVLLYIQVVIYIVHYREIV